MIRLYYEEEERKYKKRVSDYIHHEMMRLSNDRWRFNLDTKEVIEECIKGKKVHFTGIKVKIRERLSAYFNEETGSVPMIITVILEI